MPLDPLVLDDLLSHIRRFVDERLRPLEAEVSEKDAIPPSILDEMRALGLFGLSIPEAYGGLGLSMAEECRLIFEFGRTSPAFRSAFGTNVGIGSQALIRCGTEAQKQAWLPRIATGELVTAFALTEPGAGSDAAAVQTRAIRDNQSYRLSGQKIFITNADRAGLFTVVARTDPNRPGAAGLSVFLVPRESAGLTVGRPEKKMGQQGARVCPVFLDDVAVPLGNRLGEAGEGFRIAMDVLARGRIHIAALCCGTAERLIEDSIAYASERRQFGRALAEFQLVQAMIADCVAESLAAHALVLEAAARFDEQAAAPALISSAKYFASEMVGRVADRAVQIHGGAGYIADHGIERFYRDVRLFRIYEGTSQIQQLIIARDRLRSAGVRD
jgi:acyl-CoA dehydrogenase